MDLAAIRAYTNAAQQIAGAAEQTPGQDAVAGTGAPNFGTLVIDAVDSVQESLAGAEAVTSQAAMGQSDLVDVVTAVAAAEVQLETVVAVRDQVIRAYQEILRMPI